MNEGMILVSFNEDLQRNTRSTKRYRVLNWSLTWAALQRHEAGTCTCRLPTCILETEKDTLQLGGARWASFRAPVLLAPASVPMSGMPPFRKCKSHHFPKRIQLSRIQ